MSTVKKFAGQTAVYGLSTIISRSLYFVLTPIYVSVLSAKVYGVFTKMYSWTALITAIISFGFETTLFRYINKDGYSKDKVYSNVFIGIGLVCTTFLSLVFFNIKGIALWINDGNTDTLSDYIFYIRCLSLVLVIDALCGTPFSLIRINNQAVKYSVLKFLNIIFVVLSNLFFLFGVDFIIKHHLPGAEWMASWYRPHWVGYVFLANLLSSIFTFILLIPDMIKFRFLFDKKIFGEMFLYSWPILIANVSYIINENLDKIMLSKILPANISEQEIGIYGACAKISLFLSIFVQAFRLGAEPFFFSQSKEQNAGKTYARIMNYFVIVVSIIFVALVANIEILKYFVKGGTIAQRNLYWSGLGVVPLLLFGYVSLGIYMNLSVWFKLSDQTKYGFYISGIGAILTIVLNLLYIPKYSYMASAWTSLIAYATMMVLAYVWGQKNYPIPYNLKKNGMYLLLSLLLVFLSFVVCKRSLIWGNLMLFAFVGFAIFNERDDLKLVFKRK